MLKFISSAIKILHSILITYICVRICNQTPRLCSNTVLMEIGLTVISILITRKHFLDALQIVISLFLTYTLIPNNYSFLVGLFFFKIIYVYNAMGQVVQDLFQSPKNNVSRLLKIIVSIFRYTLVEYLFLGLVLLGYKLWTFNDPEGTIPEDYLILYKLIVTATTIGYGDVTPKTRFQVSYFTYLIPFICGSFVLYFNALIPVLGQLTDILSGNASPLTQEGSSTNTDSLNSKIWSPKETDSFKTFIEQVSKRQAESDEQHKKLGHNWIALSALLYERQIPLISEILHGDQTKEVKLKVSSKIRRQFYPAGWIILQSGDISEDLMMIDEGEVETPQKKGKSFVFNREGFESKNPSRISVIAKSFVVVWAINKKELEQLSKGSAKIQQVLSQSH